MKGTSKKRKVLELFGKILLGLLVFFVVLVLTIRTPWAQQFIVNKITDYVSDKTAVTFTIGNAFLTFSGDIKVEDVYLEDQKEDTLLYSKALQLDLPLYPLLFKNQLEVDDVISKGLVARIERAADPETFNFTFLLDAFATPVDSTTTTEPMSITLGDFDLKDWNVRYTDAYLGTDINLKLGELSTSFDDFNLEEMKYSISDLNLEHTEINYTQTHAFPPTPDTTSAHLPYITLENLDINKLKLSYLSVPDGLNTNINLGTLALTDMLADVSKNHYETDNFIWKNSDVRLTITKTSPPMAQTNAKTDFEWPEFILGVGLLDIENNTMTFNRNGTARTKDAFNPDAFNIKDLLVKASNFTYRPETFNISMNDFSFSEPSGIQLEQLTFTAGLKENEAKINDLVVRLNKSSANADVVITFNSLKEAFENPKESSLSAELSNLNLHLGEIQKLLPQLESNPYLDALAKKPITGSLFATGNLQKIDDFKTNIAWGGETNISAQGTLTNLTQPDSLGYDLSTVQFASVKNDIQNFISAKDLGVSLPKTIALKGSLSGTTTSIKTNSVITIPEGLARVDGNFFFGKSIRFNTNIAVDSLQLGKLLQNEQLGLVSLQMEAYGEGTSSKDLDAKVDGTISQLHWNDYSYTAMDLDGSLTNGVGKVSAQIKDPNLELTANTAIDISSDIYRIDLTSELGGADLKRLGFTKNDIKIAANLDGTFTGTPSNYTIETNIDKGVAVSDNDQYQVDPITLRAHIEDSITDVSVTSGFMNGELYSNASPLRINKALKEQLEHYFSTDTTTQVSDSVQAKLRFSVRPTPILNKVFFDGFTDFDSLNIDADFDSKKQLLYGEIKVPKISYAGSSLDSLNVLLNGDATDLRFSAGLANLTYEPIHLKQTYLEGNLKNKELVLDFNAKNDSVQVMHITSQLVFQKDTVRLHIDPEELILNKKQWELPNDNGIVLADSFIDLQNLMLSRNQQKLQVSTNRPEKEQDHIGVLFENFELQTFLSLLNPDEALAKGKVQGNFALLNPFGATGLVSDIQIDNFRLLSNPLGTLTLDASSKSLSTYDFDLALKDGDAKLRLTGDYTAKETGAELNLELDIQEVKTSVAQGFFKDELSNAKGYITGSMLVGGTLMDPTYSGRINFKGAELTLSQYNTALFMNNETLDLDEEKITLSNFTIADNSKGTLAIDGEILTPDLVNPAFDLSVKTDRFRVLNSEKGDNELVYGIASIDADLEVLGDLELPVINGKIRVREVTDLTYVVPKEQLDIQERDGVVIFVNKENPDAILTRNESQPSNSVFAGMDINTTLEISNDATFTVVLDEKTQDMLKASGEAVLNLNIDPNKDILLSGRLELNSGFYRTSLYNLVSREFQIKKGSTIDWGGDPYDAKLDVTAIYEIETSASPLMSSISGGQDSGVTGTYQQATDFLVYLNVEGQLTTPELSFALDMPENAQGNFGGAVYGRIQQLNEQESELNKQVFSLLALNRFYPTTGSDGSNGGAITLARNNVNKVLSSELNAISDKILGNSGFELGFDLDSFEDYESGTAQSRTQLNINASKKLFNDRLIVTAGSALDVEGSAASEDSATPIIGNVTLEYLLNEKGIYRLKGFRRQEYQNIIDGQLVVTGIAFIFNREFNKFSQLFSPLRKFKTEDDKTDKKENQQ